MIRRSAESVVATWLAGLLVLLPLALSLALFVWLVGVLIQLVGPSSSLGRLFSALGYPLVGDSPHAYLIGSLLLVAAIYPLGLVVQLGLKGPLERLADRTLRRIPLFGPLYDLADRFVGLLDKKQDADLRAMSPVWCLFGGDGAAVLALAPNPDPVQIDGRSYRAVLIPTAPVPFGGALLYVPAEWVRPARIGIEQLTAVYVSMGISPPRGIEPGGAPPR
jgi:uncharacterized membrane protein